MSIPLGENGIIAHESVVTVTLFRQGQYQVELVMLLPNAPAWPGEHRHPNIDSYEVAVDDDNAPGFTLNGEVFENPHFCVRVLLGADQGGLPVYKLCPVLRLKPTDWHGTVPRGAKGGVLMSVQRWKDGVSPTSVGKDWEGEPVVEGHKRVLNLPDATFMGVGK